LDFDAGSGVEQDLQDNIKNMIEVQREQQQSTNELLR
jgi:hypothetical protein